MGAPVSTGRGPAAVVERLVRSTNDHDLDALVGCFAQDYRSVNPLHPARDFDGSGQVRRNWERILRLVPDVRIEVLGLAVDGATAWVEMEHRGTRPDGTPHLMRGITTFEVAGDRIVSARFYLEPVEDGGVDAAGAVATALEPGART